MKSEVSIVIPTYNRGNILPKTIPTYIQPGVGEVILVDDCSSDNTREVVESLQAVYPEIKYIRLDENRKQSFAKNQGIKHASMPYIYFGDDDSILVEGSIQTLLCNFKYLSADIVGAKALYMCNLSEMDDIVSYVKKHDIYTDNLKDLFDLDNLKVNFTLSLKEPVEVPFTQASFLIRKAFAEKVLYDDTYLGNAYREETDFLVRASQMGAKIYYQSKAVQVNLPRCICTGGAHSGGRLNWYISTIKNNWKFLKKNYPYLKRKYKLSKNIYTLQLMFILEFLTKGTINLIKVSLKFLLKNTYGANKQ